MIFYSTINSNKDELLVENFFKLIDLGAKTEEILVLVQNGRKKKKLADKIKKNFKEGNIGNLNIFSFFGLARNFIEKNYPLVENIIKDPNAQVFSHLCGLEVSQYIFKNCIKEVEFKGYNSKVNLLHQLFRRYSLIVQNALNEEDIKFREQILKESYADDVAKAIKLYKLKTLNLRAFDYLRQVGIFEYLYKNVKNPYKYVIVDDADEITPACFEYLKYIKKDIKEFIIAQDPFGSSRLGYLSATHIDFEKFLDQKALDKRENNKKNQVAQELFNSIKNKKPIALKDAAIKSFIKRDEMIDFTINEIQNLVNNKVKPSEIAVITPCADEFLKYQFKQINQEVFFLSGSEKLNQNPQIATIVEILKIINCEKFYLSPFVLKNILLETLKLETNDALEISQGYREENYEFKKDIKEFLQEVENPTIKEFLELCEKIKEKKLSEQLYEISAKYIAKKQENQGAILKLNKLFKQISDFEEVFGDDFDKLKLIEQIENTIISENPLSEEEIPENAIIISTAQKLIDSEIKVKHLFLIDTSNSNWIKQDIGMLYNSWVFQKNWEKPTFELKDNLDLTLDRTARILYKLYLCKSEKIYLYSSIYDTQGIENFGAIDKFFLGETKNKEENLVQKITPRDDQKPVLEYKKGKMAVSAVAGSGKTTIMLVLILKLLEGEIIKDLKSENIFVLTFMESAARNFRERIKQAYPDMVEMPQISTIHGLCLKILKENNNYSFVNLDNDFEIVDENKRREILLSIFSNLGHDLGKIDLYDRAISEFKNEGSNFDTIKSPSFKSIFKAYDAIMKENNLIDYDDLLALALRLLEENESVREYYQNLAKIIIEDEAQDSSPIQQEIIKILGGKWGNIVRCGDVNQAITATFSNSDVKGFKKFIKENYNVEMNKSQRCGVEIINLANETIDYAKQVAPEAFLDVKMHPVEGKNSTNKDAISLKVFENEKEEKDFILNEIKNIKKKYPEKSIGVLTRSNWALNNWAEFLEGNYIKTAKNFDTLNNNLVFRVVLAIFSFICDPKHKKTLLESLEILLDLPQYQGEREILTFAKNEDFLSQNGEKYQLWWDLKYFLCKNSPTPMELVLEIGNYYFKNTLENSNIAMVYTVVENLYKTQKTFEATVLRMREIANKINKSVNFFKEEKQTQNEQEVRIMTLHKAKGDEFDFVFIPELSVDNLALKNEDVELKENTKFLRAIKTNPKSEEELRQEIADENFRLLYVGITRAKLKLYISCAKTYKVYKKDRKTRPSDILETKGEDYGHV